MMKVWKGDTGAQTETYQILSKHIMKSRTHSSSNCVCQSHNSTFGDSMYLEAFPAVFLLRFAELYFLRRPVREFHSNHLLQTMD